MNTQVWVASSEMHLATGVHESSRKLGPKLKTLDDMEVVKPSETP